MSLASEMTRLQTAKENFQVALEYLGGSVEQDELFSDYPDKFAHMPFFMVPDEVNYGYGYIDGNGWMYEDNGYVKNPIDIYKIKQDHSYFIMLGEHIGTRFRVCTVLEQDDIRTKTSGRFKDMAINNENAPKGSWPVMTMYSNPNYSNAKTPFFTAANDGWLLIQKDNVGDLNVKSYVFDIDTPTLVTEDYVTTLDENLFDIANGIVTLKSGADITPIRGRVRIPATVNGQAVTGVADHFFENIISLGGVEFASDITYIGAYAFAGTSLIDGIYPQSVTTIGDYAFANCTGLRGSVYVRQNVTSFGVGVWEGTIKLTDCRIYSPYITTLTRTFKGSLVNYINNNPGLAVTTFDGTFYQATNVTDVASTASCPNLTTLTNGAYYGCPKFVDITIPSNITTIGPETFKNCVNLTAVTMESSTPPALLNVNAFENTNDCPIYVPDSAVSAYQSATNWSDLATRITGVSNKPSA